MNNALLKSIIVSVILILGVGDAYAVNRCLPLYTSERVGKEAKATSLAEPNKLESSYNDISGNKNPLLQVLLTGIKESAAIKRLGAIHRGNYAPKFDRVVIDKEHGDRTVLRPSGKPHVYGGIKYSELPNSTAMTTVNSRTGKIREFSLTRGIREYEAGIRLDKKGENSPDGYVSDVLLFEIINGRKIFRSRLLESAPELNFRFEDNRISVTYESKTDPHFWLSGTDYSPHVKGSESPDVMNRYVELKINENGLPLPVEVDPVTKKPDFKNLSPEPRETEWGIAFTDAKNATISQNEEGNIVVRTRLRPDFNHPWIQKIAGDQKWNYAEQVFEFRPEDFARYNWNDALIDLFGKTETEQLASPVRPLIAKTIMTEKDLREHLGIVKTIKGAIARLAGYKPKGLGPGTRPLRVQFKNNRLQISDNRLARQFLTEEVTADLLARLNMKEGEVKYITFDHEIRYFEQVVDGKVMLRRHYSASVKVFDSTLTNMIDYLPDVIQPIRLEERGYNSGIVDLQHVYPMGFTIIERDGRVVVRVYAGASDAHTTLYEVDIVTLLTERR